MMTFCSTALSCLLAILFSPSLSQSLLNSTNLTNVSQDTEQSWVRMVATKKKPAKSTPSIQIRNVRYHHHARYTRLVLDLSSPVRYSNSGKQAKTQANIRLNHAVLSQAARATLAQKHLPTGVQVSPLSKHRIQISLNLKQVKKYKIYRLANPHRLVLDLYYFPNVQRKTQSDSQGITPRPVIKPNPNPQKPFKEMLIVIDPGHGGKDPGAIGRKGTQEKHITLAIAERLKNLLKKRLDTRVTLTRDNDRFLSLEDRVQIANQKKADVFVSIHVNSHPKKTVHGLELYHFGKASDPRALAVAARENGTPLKNGAPAWQFILADKLNDQKIDESRNFAWMTREVLVKALKKHYPINDHGIKTAPFYVLRFTTMPSILAEVAFVSNPIEEKRLRDVSFQRRMAEGIFRGIKTYLLSKPFEK